MCGICGVLNPKGITEEEQLVIEKMKSTLTHRGPDGAGTYSDPDGLIILGHTRLKIIDLSERAAQPMPNETGDVWVTYNGEIYNFLELRSALEQQGHRFKSASDTEVLVHLYGEKGERMLEDINGMFAFALWDERHQRLMLARDRVGKKPLFYAEANGKFLFASEIQALLQVPWLPRNVDYQAIDQYLTYGYIPAPHTAFKVIKKLPPASYLTLQNGKVKIERYWSLEYLPKLQISEEEACGRLLELLKEAVKLRMISDVPLGAFLSGGIDSSAIVALMSQLSDKPVKTFSIGFEEAAYNELNFAQLIAQRFNTEHHEFIVRPKALEILPKLVRHYGEPYADSSAIPTFYVSSETRQHVTVALNGDGGDENFAGYERYYANKIATYYQKIPAIVRRKVIEKGISFLPGLADVRSNIQRIKRFCQSAGMPVEKRYLSWIGLFDANSKRKLYSSEFLEKVDVTESEQWLGQFFNQNDALDIIDTTICADVHSYLPYDLLVKVDITSMANSLEARSPFLDPHVMEFAARLPSHYKLRRRTHKYILKKAMREILPKVILHRKKTGFGVPVDGWFRNELKPLLYDTILSPKALCRGYFNSEVLKQMVEEHVTGQKAHGHRLWALLMLEMWHREFID